MGSEHKRLAELARTPTRELDLAEVERRGRRGRALAVAGRSALAVGVVSLLGTILLSLPSDEAPRLEPARPSPSESERPTSNGAVFESVDEQVRAEIFAFRALAATELMDPHGKRSYNWTYEEDTTRTDEGWRVGFVASDCEPRNNSWTCTSVSGEDLESRNPLADTFVTVSLGEEKWTVVDVEGEMLEEERTRIIGYSLSDRREPSHWDFAAVGVWGKEFGIAMTPIWVGPYPTRAPGSVCEAQWVDDAGSPVGEPSLFYQEPPDRSFERGGWGRSGGLEMPTEAVADATVTCEQYTGAGWELASEPEIEGAPGEVVGAAADVMWQGDEGFTTGATCTATLENAEGSTVWEGSGKVEPLWRPGELKRYPYEATVYVSTGGEPVDAEKVGRFECESR